MRNDKAVEIIVRLISRSMTFSPRKLFRLWANVQNYCRAGHATDNSMEHAHFMMDTYGCKYVLEICNAFPPQQWLRECAWTLRYTCIACRVVVCSLVCLTLRKLTFSQNAWRNFFLSRRQYCLFTLKRPIFCVGNDRCILWETYKRTNILCSNT
jgi:hypothetical protein